MSDLTMSKMKNYPTHLRCSHLCITFTKTEVQGWVEGRRGYTPNIPQGCRGPIKGQVPEKHLPTRGTGLSLGSLVPRCWAEALF